MGARSLVPAPATDHTHVQTLALGVKSKRKTSSFLFEIQVRFPNAAPRVLAQSLVPAPATDHTHVQTLALGVKSRRRTSTSAARYLSAPEQTSAARYLSAPERTSAARYLSAPERTS